MEKGNYKKFLIMLLLSFVTMYAVMYLNVAEVDHIYLNLSRTYMTLMMVCPMGIIMLALMRGMYQRPKLNITIIITSIIVFFCALAGMRTQTAISDVQYMKGMIPHHSIAILTSKNANIKDPEVRKLADGIIATQEKEIAEMKAYIKRLESDNIPHQ